MELINFLPEVILEHVLSFTSPRDACRSSATSSIFRSAAKSDVVWERFLPSDYRDILQRSVSPIPFCSKKELYFQLCNPILIDGGKRMFSLERSSGKKCYRLSARELSITWADDPMHWSWKPMPQLSRFPEVVELRMMLWLEIHGKINTQILSPNTLYGAYLIVDITERAYGLDTLPSEISVEVAGSCRTSGSGTTAAYLRRPDHDNYLKQLLEQLCYSHRQEVLHSRLSEVEYQRVACDRGDGWMEVELGEFFNHGGNEEVKMSLMEMKGVHLKGGLVVEGIEVRPKHFN